MRLTKDESRIIAEAVKEFRYSISDERGNPDGFTDALFDLETRLQASGKDNRRKGRASEDAWSDLVKRFSNKKKESK